MKVALGSHGNPLLRGRRVLFRWRADRLRKLTLDSVSRIYTHLFLDAYFSLFWILKWLREDPDSASQFKNNKNEMSFYCSFSLTAFHSKLQIFLLQSASF